MVDKKFVVNLQGKEFITFEGLLAEFHSNGGNKIFTEIVCVDPFVVKATASGDKGEFSGIGDANDQNCGSLIAKHKIRMAETRAIARALRWYNNIGMCSTSELESTQEVKEEQLGETASGVPTGASHVPKNNECVGCGIEVVDVVLDYSTTHFGKVLCRDCQDKERDKK